MQQATVGSDKTNEYILKLEREFHQLQLYAMQQAKENYLKTEFILESDIIMDSFCDYLKKLSVDEIEDNYMGITQELVNDQLSQYDVTDEEIQQFLASL